MSIDNSSSAGENQPELELKKIWGMPIRLFHWMLAILFAVGFYIGENLTFDNINWHFRIGYAIGVLVVLRIIWGFIGPRPARFSDFFPTPKRLFAYMSHAGKREPSGEAGHSAFGGASVLALLAMLLVQVISGLLSYSDSFFAGSPIHGYFSENTNLLANQIHFWSGRILFALVVLHLAAIAFYRIWKRENLVKPMITGWKWVRRKR
jgi:cytochrome b